MDFTKFTFPAYVAEPAHALIAATLDRCIAGEIKRLMIFAPPQHGKSELVSVRLPAFWLGKRPNDPIILSSYGADLAYSKSRQARTIVESDDFAELFPAIETRHDSRAVDHWELIAPHRGGMLAAGVGGPITGHGARLGIIDDPFENWEQAQSEVYRNRVWEWWRTTYRPRIWEHGCIILIMTRWHEDDLAGRLIAEQGKDWTILRLPALAETQKERDEENLRVGLALGQNDPLERDPDEPLCPRRYSKAALLALRTDVGSGAWMAEFQGSPRAPEGNRIKRAWLPIIDALPTQIIRRVRYWDHAATSGGGKFTAGVLIGATVRKEIIIENVVRGQWSSGERDVVVLQTAQLDAAKYENAVQIHFEEEGGSAGKDSSAAQTKLLSGFPVHADRVTGSKDVRLEPFAAQAEAGNVRLLLGAWNAAYIDELTAVPNGRFRDQADATAGGFNKLEIGNVSMSDVGDKGDVPSRWEMGNQNIQRDRDDEERGPWQLK